jgi:hypothetical protein
LVAEQEHGLYSFDRRDLPVELEELRECVAGIESECTAEVVQLSRSVMEISNALVDVGVFPIWDIPMHPESVQCVLMMTSLILERTWEEHASGVGPWV